MVITTHDDNIDGGFCAHFCDAIFFVEIFFSRCFLCFFCCFYRDQNGMRETSVDGLRCNGMRIKIGVF